MPAAVIAQYAIQLLGLMPSLIAAGQSVMALVNQGTTSLQNMIAENREPTEAEWGALDAARDAVHAAIQKA